MHLLQLEIWQKDAKCRIGMSLNESEVPIKYIKEPESNQCCASQRATMAPFLPSHALPLASLAATMLCKLGTWLKS